MNYIYEETKTVRAYDVDFNNKIKISSVFNLMQDVASVHADQLGLGFKDLYKLDLGWVLSWVKLNINEYPSFGDFITIKTWPKCKYRLFSMRDFHISNKSGKIIITATSAWIPINTKTKKITDTKNLPWEIVYQPDLIAVDEFPEKIIMGDEKETLSHKKFKYTDIDINQHVNNTRYIEMILDCYKPERYKTNQIKNFEIFFTAESFFYDEVEISRFSSDSFDIYRGANLKTLKQVFISKLEWAQ